MAGGFHRACCCSIVQPPGVTCQLVALCDIQHLICTISGFSLCGEMGECGFLRCETPPPSLQGSTEKILYSVNPNGTHILDNELSLPAQPPAPGGPCCFIGIYDPRPLACVPRNDCLTPTIGACPDGFWPNRVPCRDPALPHPKGWIFVFITGLGFPPFQTFNLSWIISTSILEVVRGCCPDPVIPFVWNEDIGTISRSFQEATGGFEGSVADLCNGVTFQDTAVLGGSSRCFFCEEILPPPITGPLFNLRGEGILHGTGTLEFTAVV